MSDEREIRPEADAPRVAPRRFGARAALVVALVFALGAVSGAAVAWLVRQRIDVAALERDRRGRGPMRRQLAVELDLDAAQREKIGAILRTHRAELAAIADRVQPDVQAVMERMRLEMRAALRPDQQQRFDRLIATHRMLDRMHHGPGGGRGRGHGQGPGRGPDDGPPIVPPPPD
ncbi:MAG: hypothetical protein ABFD84_04920 [Candidatus Polarisedimenticolia bacterium]